MTRDLSTANERNTCIKYLRGSRWVNIVRNTGRGKRDTVNSPYPSHKLRGQSPKGKNISEPIIYLSNNNNNNNNKNNTKFTIKRTNDIKRQIKTKRKLKKKKQKIYIYVLKTAEWTYVVAARGKNKYWTFVAGRSSHTEARCLPPCVSIYHSYKLADAFRISNNCFFSTTVF